MPKKSNDIANEVWGQLYARAAKAEDAAIVDANYNPADDDARARAALKSAGWSDEHIDQRFEIHRQREASAPVTSPGVNPFVESQLKQLCDDVEEVMDRLKMDSHAKVARGVEPRAWASASKINVITTDESIVTVSAFLFRFCGLIARAFTRTLHLNPYIWEHKDFSEKTVHEYFQTSPELFRYWLQIYMSFALTGTHINVPYKPATPSEVLVFEHIARAMEIFVIAHEYGHHHHAHGKGLGSDPQAEEFEADQFALKISGAVKQFPPMLENPYLKSGAGGVVMLLALDTLRDVQRLFGNASETTLDTHPDVLARIERFDSVALLEPREFARLNGFRLAAQRVMGSVHSILLPAIAAISKDKLRSLAEHHSSGSAPP